MMNSTNLLKRAIISVCHLLALFRCDPGGHSMKAHGLLGKIISEEELPLPVRLAAMLTGWKKAEKEERIKSTPPRWTEETAHILDRKAKQGNRIRTTQKL